MSVCHGIEGQMIKRSCNLYLLQDKRFELNSYDENIEIEDITQIYISTEIYWKGLWEDDSHGEKVNR